MSENTQIDKMLSQIPIDDLAASLGVDSDTVLEAVSTAVPGLLGGMAYNTSKGGEEALENALAEHQDDAEVVSVEQIDTADGAKIVEKVFGEDQDQAVAALAGATSSQTAQSILPKLLPMIAPLVMGMLAKNMSGTRGGTAKKSSAGGGVGDLLGGILGSGSKSSGGLGSILGGGGLGSILGSLLGGK